MDEVVHVAHSLDFGGVETHLQLIAAHGGTGYRHRFLALETGGAAADAIREAGARVETLDLGAWATPMRAWRTLRRRFAMERPAVVHAHGTDATLFALWPARLAGVPIRIGEEIGRSSDTLKARVALRAAYFAAQKVVAISDDVRRHLLDTREAPPAKIEVLANPIRHAPVGSHPRSDGAPLAIAFLGRLEVVKNCGALIDAVLMLRQQGLPLTLQIVGDGSERTSLERRIADSGHDDAVTFHGFVPQPWPVLADCHLYVQPSISEGFGIALAEAMSAGLPVVASRGGMSELVAEGVTGWLIDRPTPTEIAEAIAAAVRMDPERLASMGDAARRSVAGRFSADRYIASLESLYDRVRGAR